MSWYNDSWGYRQKITLDKTNVGENLTNFPVLISLTDALLKTVAQGGHVGNAGATDIVFTNSSGTKLDHEIQTYNAATGNLIAWVEVDSITTANNTDIYMYYGNAGVADQQNINGTWGNGFVMVHHMDGAAYTNLDDATSYHNDVVSENGSPAPGYNTAAVINNGVNFVLARSNGLTVGNSASLQIGTDKLTISCWYNTTTLASFTVFVDKNEMYRLLNLNTSFFTLATTNNSWYSKTVTGSTVIENTGPHLIAGIYDGSAIYSFVDTAIDGTTTGVSGNLVTNTNNVLIGMGTSGNYLNGILDEVRIANTNRSENWLKAEYYSQSSPATFCSYTAEEPLPVVKATSVGGTQSRRNLQNLQRL